MNHQYFWYHHYHTQKKATYSTCIHINPFYLIYLDCFSILYQLIASPISTQNLNVIYHLSPRDALAKSLNLL